MTDHKKKSFNQAVTTERHQKMIKKMKRRQKLQAATKKLKRNRQPKPVRRKSWLAHNLEEWDELDYEFGERIMPRGERERRRTLEKTTFDTSDTDLAEPDPTTTSNLEGREGQVLEVSQGLCRVDLGSRILLCSVRSTLTAKDTGFTNVVAVGDQVIVRHSGG